MRATDEKLRSTDLYRFYDNRGRLLYVGISFNTLTRMQQHMRDKGWFCDVSDITIEKFPTREAAVLAEEMAIKIEAPIHNGTHAPMVREHKQNPGHIEAARQLAEVKAAPVAPGLSNPHESTHGLPRLLKLNEVKQATGIGTSTIYRRLAAGTFPRPKELSPGCVRWVESEILQWLNSLPETSRRVA